MPFKLSSHALQVRAELLTRLIDGRSDLELALSTYNDALEEAADPLHQALSDYNDILQEAAEFAQEIAENAAEDISDKSDKWQEGETGQSAASWQSEWQSASFDPPSLDLPGPLSLDIEDHADLLQSLPTEA